MSTVISCIAAFAELVKLSHSVFALPFALVMVVFVGDTQSVTALQLGLLVLSIVFARTAAMGFNRLVDADVDALNPRTRVREIPAGKVSRRGAVGLVILTSIGFFVCAGSLGVHCLWLAPPVLALLFAYSYFKRFSALCHVVLGLALALAPGGVWYALTATWSWKPTPLMGAVLTWVAGFDILYSCQDEAFDRASGLHSIPAALGVRGALYTAVALHLTSIGLLVLLGVTFDRGPVYFAGVFVFAAILASQYRSIYRHGIQCIDQVFFTRNGLASIGFFIAVVADSLA